MLISLVVISQLSVLDYMWAHELPTWDYQWDVYTTDTRRPVVRYAPPNVKPLIREN